jgi:hypothetical protein
MSYLMAGQQSELERLHLQSRVWEPAGEWLLSRLGDGVTVLRAFGSVHEVLTDPVAVFAPVDTPLIVTASPSHPF